MEVNSKYDEIIAAIYSALSKCQIHPEACLSVECAAETTIGSLALDSLDLLQFAMDVEDALNVEIDIVEFPAEITIKQIADHVATLTTLKTIEAKD